MTAALPVLDLGTRDFWADPHPTLAAVLAESPLAQGSDGSLMVLGYPEVQQVLRDPALGTVDLLARVGIIDGPLAEWWQRVMFSNDPPAHTRLRRLVSYAFTPRRVGELEPVIARIAADVLDTIDTSSSFDLVDAFAHQVPLRTMAHILSIPDNDLPTFGGWTSELGLVFAPVMTAELRARLETTIVALDGYVSTLIEERRRKPGDDLLSALIAVEESGDRLTSQELVALVANLVFAGHDTTRSLLSIAPVVLLDHPHQLALVRAEPHRWPAAVDEVLRFEPPVLGTARRTLAPIELGGHAIGAGRGLSTNLLAANRDPRVFAEPDRFNIRRDFTAPNGAPIASFGAGVHFCLGAALARLEARVALKAFFDTFDDVTLLQRPAWVPYASIRRYDTVRVAASRRGSSA